MINDTNEQQILCPVNMNLMKFVQCFYYTKMPLVISSRPQKRAKDFDIDVNLASTSMTN